MSKSNETLVAGLSREFNLLNQPLGPMEDEEFHNVVNRMIDTGESLARSQCETFEDVLAKMGVLCRLLRENLHLSENKMNMIAYTLAEGARDDLAVLLLAERI